MAKIVVALGGNALGNDPQEQKERAKIAASAVADLIQDGHEILIGHGNGPQVGMIKKAFDDTAADMPFPECTAMSQGYIGYHLQAAVEGELRKRGITDRPVVSLVTRTAVDAADPAFAKPTKPVGNYYDEAAALKLMEETGDTYAEDAGRGWRRMVASPLPVDILEKNTVINLLENKHIVIASGGGGIPVAMINGVYTGMEAVVDKDFASALLARLTGADMLIILTAVDSVLINFRKPNEEAVTYMTAAQAQAYAGEGHFAPGSMLPKVLAGCLFVKGGKNKSTIITSLEKAAQALRGECGTRIID